MRAIDTNVLVRLLVRDDLSQLAIAEASVAHGAWISLVALAETMWVVRSAYSHSREAIAEAVDMLLGHATIIVQEPDVVRAALGRFKSNGRVAFTDCLLLEIARKAGHTPLATFDRDLAKLDGVEGL
jgi:predicted nucleic-acid-binding protein